MFSSQNVQHTDTRQARLVVCFLIPIVAGVLYYGPTWLR